MAIVILPLVLAAIAMILMGRGQVSGQGEIAVGSILTVTVAYQGWWDCTVSTVDDNNNTE